MGQTLLEKAKRSSGSLRYDRGTDATVAERCEVAIAYANGLISLKQAKAVGLQHATLGQALLRGIRIGVVRAELVTGKRSSGAK